VAHGGEVKQTYDDRGKIRALSYAENKDRVCSKLNKEIMSKNK
jgi:hypothetical protein